MLNIQDIFKKKTELLCKGLYLNRNNLEDYNNQTFYLDYGRKGGAGPLGGRYFLFDDDKTLVNIALKDLPHRTDLTLKFTQDQFYEIYNKDNNNHFCNLKLIKYPNYYSSIYKTSDGIPMKKIALIHGIDCLATTIYQKCSYWDCGNACKFCGIQLSLANNDTIVEKSAKQILEVIDIAKKEGRCSHITLTSGTDSSKDKGALRYINIIRQLKDKHPELPIHIQIEPLEDLTFLNKIKESGADTIGIHIEILNDKLRKKITPGKYKLPYKLFIENWKYAVDIFGNNQVETYILTGFGESTDELFRKIEEIISIGVIPFITPVRAIPGKYDIESPINPIELLKIYRRTAKLMKENGINPLEHKAGCVKCGGCSAINEAYKSVNS